MRGSERLRVPDEDTPMNAMEFVSVRDGLATLGPGAVRVMEHLDARVRAWAAARGALPLSFPAVTKVADLSRIDYFRNFPHLGVAASRIRAERLGEYAAATPLAEVGGGDLAPAEYMLPSAACYGVYFHLAGRELTRPCYVTTVARCFRNESGFAGLERLWGFTMREIVCVATAEEVRECLASARAWIQELSDRLGLGLKAQPASDPFYDRQGSRALLQQLAPVKEEFVYGDTVAVASINVHRNFFGERCDIRGPGGVAFSGCVAFGLERWLHALIQRFGESEEAIDDALAAA